MNKTKLRILALALSLITLIAGLAAYFTSADSATNTFGSSALQIRVIEPNWKNNPTIVPEQIVDKDPYIVNTDETPAYVFMEVTVPVQEVTIEKNSGDSEKGIAITSVENTTDASGSTASVTDASHYIPLFRFINSEGTYSADQLGSQQLYNTGWYAMTDHTTVNKDSSGKTVSITYLYAWTDSNDPDCDDMAVLYPDQKTNTPLFDKVIFCNAREDGSLPGSMQNISIKVYGIQTQFLKSSDETETKAEKVWQYLTAN